MTIPSRHLWKCFAVAALVAAACTVWMKGRHGADDGAASSQEAPHVRKRTARDRDAAGESGSPRSEMMARTAEFARSLEEAPDLDSRKLIWNEWTRYFQDMQARTTPGELAVFIGSVLRSGIDARSGMRFQVALDGSLSESTSIRVFLIDRIQRVDPVMALELSREIIGDASSQNEYAVALRNLARASTKQVTQSEIDAAFSGLVGREAWRNAPEPGLLEAFDVAVGKPSPATVGQLVKLDGKRAATDPETQGQLDNAATLALDRIMQRAPDVVLRELNSRGNDGIGALSPAYRTAIMMRVDVTTEEGRKALGGYLNNPAVGEAEKSRFLSVYPTGSYYAGARMVTRSEVNSPHNIYRIYRQSYATALEMQASGELSAEHAEKLLAGIRKYFPAGE